VLPLANLSGDPEQEYYADGMTETLIAELAKLPGVRVISRTSVMQFKGAKTPLPEIAKQLNVDGVIEGSVMRAESAVRITAQLIDARSDQHVWAEQYDRELARVFEIQSEVARAVADQIALALTYEEAARFKPPRPVDPRAQEAYLRSLGFLGFEATLGALSEATAIDPEFARAHAALAKTYSAVAIYQPTLVPDAASKARASALRAISLDDSLAESHEALGRIAFYFDWDWATAEREFRRAIDLAYGVSTARADLADLLLATGRRSEAFEESRLSVDESQGDSRARSQRALLLKVAGKYEEAIAEAEAARARDPRNFLASARISEATVLLGRKEEAIKASRRVLETPGFGPWKADGAELERALRAGGIPAYWRALRDIASRDEKFVSEAEARAQLGEIDEAIAALERGYRARNPQMRHLVSREGLAPLRSDPRFADLARRMNLPLPNP
jgi:TolB-like protein/thioredoxin-like negative regulator of GroEL